MEDVPIPLKPRDGCKDSLNEKKNEIRLDNEPITLTNLSERYHSDSLLVSLTGDREPIFDSIVLGLAGKIEEVAEIYNLNKHSLERVLEVEGRIGVLKDKDTNSRIRLPVDSEVLLDAPNSLFSYRFESGVPKQQYHRIIHAIHDALDVPTDGIGHVLENATVFGRDPVQRITTNDLFMDINERSFENLNIPKHNVGIIEPRRVRMSYSVEGTSHSEHRSTTPSEIIWKDRLFTLNCYTGKDKEEGVDGMERCHLLDIRIAINIEYHLPLTIQRSEPIMKRERQRISYPIKQQYRIDTTIVKETESIRKPHARGQISHRDLYEIEVEMNPDRLLEELNKKIAGQPHYFFHLIKDFLGILRDISSLMNVSTMTTQTHLNHTSHVASSPSLNMTCHGRNRDGMVAPPLPSSSDSSLHHHCLTNLTECQHPSTDVERYVAYISPVVPLIGDYLFRAVAPQREFSHEDTLTIEDQLSSRKIALTSEEQIQLKDRTQRFTRVHGSGFWD